MHLSYADAARGGKRGEEEDQERENGGGAQNGGQDGGGQDGGAQAVPHGREEVQERPPVAVEGRPGDSSAPPPPLPTSVGGGELPQRGPGRKRELEEESAPSRKEARRESEDLVEVEGVSDSQLMEAVDEDKEGSLSAGGGGSSLEVAPQVDPEVPYSLKNGITWANAGGGDQQGETEEREGGLEPPSVVRVLSGSEEELYQEAPETIPPQEGASGGESLRETVAATVKQLEALAEETGAAMAAANAVEATTAAVAVMAGETAAATVSSTRRPAEEVPRRPQSMIPRLTDPRRRSAAGAGGSGRAAHNNAMGRRGEN